MGIVAGKSADEIREALVVKLTHMGCSRIRSKHQIDPIGSADRSRGISAMGWAAGRMGSTLWDRFHKSNEIDFMKACDRPDALPSVKSAQYSTTTRDLLRQLQRPSGYQTYLRIFSYRTPYACTFGSVAPIHVQSPNINRKISGVPAVDVVLGFSFCVVVPPVCMPHLGQCNLYALVSAICVHEECSHPAEKEWKAEHIEAGYGLAPYA